MTQEHWNAILCPECGERGTAVAEWHSERFVCRLCGASGPYTRERVTQNDISQCYAHPSGRHKFVPQGTDGEAVPLTCENPHCGVGTAAALRRTS